uniref:Uncharacterized protein n=1 Tax=Chromera velia CCMP2878 TaxID=1169474 RepID=A0A0G4I432_9ALVE|eukprot:Cvel_10817.t1-p1 / transcript=Cvel_10817.t1 / gene=Cvel_10817 / organism=Chromera_velia_CCMP2878 / gene_product=hypothetical protein / transcript_product=hypothetical protein / location=Cvel_scaffold661:60385-61726(+) / protein_length=124 / sequence_SO=supercontig / SO=protein_coding / is_pseudo=false
MEGESENRCWLPLNVYDDAAELPIQLFREAACRRDADSMRVLLNSGTPPSVPLSASRTTALHIAASYNDIQMALLLKRFGADHWARDQQMRTPVSIARSNKYAEMVALLEEPIWESKKPKEAEE